VPETKRYLVTVDVSFIAESSDPETTRNDLKHELVRALEHFDIKNQPAVRIENLPWEEVK
jgi:hypothetical protein